MSNDKSTGGSSIGSAFSHQDLIRDQFSRQAALFARSPELHAEAQLHLLVDMARPQSSDAMLDVACGPGSVVAAFARHVQHAVGLDATEAMLDEARALAADSGLVNVAWRLGDVYALPFADARFDIVTCRFAFHHFEVPDKAFDEMVRVCRPGGRILLCDGVASADPAKAAAFNAMERHRDPSTAAFRPGAFLADLFKAAGLPSPRMSAFQVVYAIDDLIAKSFPAEGDRATLRRMIEELIADDALDVGTRPGDGHFIYPAIVLAATKSP